MAQWLRVLTVLPEDLGSIPSIHMAAHNCNSSVPVNLAPSHRHTYRKNTNMHKVKISKLNKNKNKISVSKLFFELPKLIYFILAPLLKQADKMTQ